MLSPQWMLVAGIALSNVSWIHQRFGVRAKKWSAHLLQVSIILLGSALDFNHVLKQGSTGVLTTFVSISLVFIFGYVGIRVFKLDTVLGTLITMGTAICGGSAIGALAPVLSASSIHVGVSIGVVFLLNALSVFIFPPIGHYFSLGQPEFGLWSALAIHDTSAVVASASVYGSEALTVATTLKLTRALWIIPITLTFGILQAKNKNKFTIPWFILGFLIFSIVFTLFEALAPAKPGLLLISKQGFAVTLFLIGLSFNLKSLREVGPRPLLFGVSLWVLVAVGSFFFVYL